MKAGRQHAYSLRRQPSWLAESSLCPPLLHSKLIASAYVVFNEQYKWIILMTL